MSAPLNFRRWKFSRVLVVSIALHLLFLGLAALYVVSHYSNARRLTFQAGPKSPNASERVLQHRVQMQQKNQTPLSAVPKRILSTGLTQIALPEMPVMPAIPANNLPRMSGAGGANFSGNNSLGSGSLGGNNAGSALNFFGIRDTSSNVVIMIDVSDSMFTRTGDAAKSKLLKLGAEQNFQVVRAEAIKLVQALGAGSRFGLVRWSGGAYSWQPELVPASAENKQVAIAHIQNEIDFRRAKKKPDRPGGTRHDYALEEAFRLKPETIYMITDGNATGVSANDPARKISAEDIFRAAEDGQKSLSKKARLHAIYYLTGADKAEEREMLMQLAARNGGQFRQVEAAGRNESARR